MRNKFLYLGIFFIIILLMANQMLGPGLIHELLGMLLLILVIFHISINRRWWQYIIPQLKTAPLKTLTTLGLTISIVLAIISGLIISRHLFFFKCRSCASSTTILYIGYSYSPHYISVFTDISSCINLMYSNEYTHSPRL